MVLPFPVHNRPFGHGQECAAGHDPGVHRFPCLSPSSPFCFLFVARSRKSERERRRVLRKGATLRLPATEVALFYKLYQAVLLYTNQRLRLARHVTTIAQLRSMPEEAKYELRAAFYAHRQLLEAFVQENL